MATVGGRALVGAGASPPTNSGQTANAEQLATGVRRWEQIFIVKRETAQTCAKVPKSMLSGKGGGVAQTTRRLA